jgi:hypothetical protein
MWKLGANWGRYVYRRPLGWRGEERAVIGNPIMVERGGGRCEYRSGWIFDGLEWGGRRCGIRAYGYHWDSSHVYVRRLDGRNPAYRSRDIAGERDKK